MSNKYYISSITYDDDSQTLELEWTTDIVWRFFSVPRSIYEALCRAQDREEYYRRYIMDKFKGRQKWRNLDELLSIAADILLIDDLSEGVRSTNGCNESAVHLAASRGDLEAIKLLVSLEADFDAPGDCDCTPLYGAVMCNNLEVVEYLLTLGASPNSTNDIGYTPYELASRNANPDIMQMFCKFDDQPR
jgi:KTSC domain/Ankyrin repeats (3 copies)